MDGMGDFEGEFEDATCSTQFTHVCARKKATLEVECCDSRFDKYLTSPRSAGMFRNCGDLDTSQQTQQAPGGLLKDVGRLTSCVHLWKQYSEVIFTDRANIQWLSGQCMPALDSSQKNPELVCSHESQPFVSNAYVSTRFPE